MQRALIETDRDIADRIPAAEHPTGHDLLAVDAWLPGTRPSEYAIELTTGPTYRARYWRCRACDAERNRPDDFDAVCPGRPLETVVTDNGYFSDVERSGRAREKLFRQTDRTDDDHPLHATGRQRLCPTPS